MGGKESTRGDVSDKLELKEIEQFAWIVDAPLFIDDAQVGKIYDAVVRPVFEHVQTTTQATMQTSATKEGQIDAAAKLKIPSFAQFLLPMSGEAGIGGKFRGQSQEMESSGKSEVLRLVDTSERRLEELTRYYYNDFRERMFFWQEDSPDLDRAWLEDAEYARKLPRALGFLDLPPKTPLIPTAAEFCDGTVELLYEELDSRLSRKCKKLAPEYPDHTKEDRLERLKEYWGHFATNFGPKDAMVVVENASRKHDQIRWIDFRVPIGDVPVHLHICPDGKYPAGAFGYNFINRGFQYGIRMACTLKGGPDLNVLAIYDR